MKNTIKRAKIDDLDVFVALFDAYRQFYEQKSDIKAARAFLSERLERNEVISYLLYDDGNVAGFANIYPTFSSVSMATVWFLNDLYIDAPFRRCGHADALMHHIATDARAAGAARLSLETARDNMPAQACYDNFGWEKGSFVSYRYDLKEL